MRLSVMRPQPVLPGDEGWTETVTTLSALSGLSPRVSEIGLCYRAGLSKKQAAARIGCSECSVTEHTRRLYRDPQHTHIINQASFAAFAEWILALHAHAEAPEYQPRIFRETPRVLR
jgi:DNA-binding NarL/FixJ family response regulator